MRATYLRITMVCYLDDNLAKPRYALRHVCSGCSLALTFSRLPARNSLPLRRSRLKRFSIGTQVKWLKRMSPSLAASATKFDSADFGRAIIDVMDFNIIGGSESMQKRAII